MTFNTNYIADYSNGGLKMVQVPDSIILTKEEFEKMAGGIWKAAIEWKKRMLYDGNDEDSVPDKEQYISSLTQVKQIK